MFFKRIEKLPQEMKKFIHEAGRIADRSGQRIYCVGGFVRDMMLDVENLDVDLVVEGDGVAFALECAQRLNLKTVTHKRFGTATLTGLDNFKVDITSARKEIYENPAQLPTVFRGKIKDDLFRRDFTINAMAIGLNGDRFAVVFDEFGGRSDLKLRLIRALHVLSFIDDPTRILRAVRFKDRLSFSIEKNTLKWIKNAVRKRMLHKVQKHRLRDEIVAIFKEEHPFKALNTLNKLCGFSYIAPGLRFKNSWKNSFQETDKIIKWFKKNFPHKRKIEPYTMYMSLFFFGLPLKEFKRVVFEFAFHKGESSRIFSLKENFKKIEKELTKANVLPSKVYHLLEPLSYETVLLISVLSKNKSLKRRIEDFLFKYNGQRLHIKGEDLKNLGISPGPGYKKIFSSLISAKIDGKVKTKEEELALAYKLGGA